MLYSKNTKMTQNDFIQNYLDNIRTLFRYYKNLGEKAIAQLDDDQIHQSPDNESNSIAIIVKHIAGNMLSRWTDFLKSDGEKTWRNREQEFINNFSTKEDIMNYWEKGWNCLFNAVEPLAVEDMSKIAYIRNEGHSVLEALNRQLGHYAYHIGQIVFLAKSLKGEHWQSLSIPKRQSATFNQEKFSQEKERKNFV